MNKSNVWKIYLFYYGLLKNGIFIDIIKIVLLSFIVIGTIMYLFYIILFGVI